LRAFLQIQAFVTNLNSCCSSILSGFKLNLKLIN
jgi:hypothetical protein